MDESSYEAVETLNVTTRNQLVLCDVCGLPPRHSERRKVVKKSVDGQGDSNNKERNGGREKEQGEADEKEKEEEKEEEEKEKEEKEEEEEEEEEEDGGAKRKAKGKRKYCQGSHSKNALGMFFQDVVSSNLSLIDLSRNNIALRGLQLRYSNLHQCYFLSLFLLSSFSFVEMGDLIYAKQFMSHQSPHVHLCVYCIRNRLSKCRSDVSQHMFALLLVRSQNTQ